MAANVKPIFVKVPKIEWGLVQTGNSAKDGTGTVATIFTAGIEGSRVEKIKIAHLGTNEACVLRLFINNGSDNNIADNNSLIEEIDISAYTDSNSAAQQTIEYTFLDGLPLPPNYKLNAAVSTTLTSGLKVTAIGGDF